MMQFSSTPSCIGLVKECYRGTFSEANPWLLLSLSLCLLFAQPILNATVMVLLVEVHYTVLHIGQKTV